GGAALPLQIVELVGHVVGLALQPLLLARQPLAFHPDLFQPPAALLQFLRGVLRQHRRGQRDRHGGEQQPPPHHAARRSSRPLTRRRCRPTLTRLPKSPSSTPKMTMTRMCCGPKNTSPPSTEVLLRNTV